MKKKHGFWHYLLVIFLALVKSLVASAVWIVLICAGYFIYQTKRSPYDLIIGLPLMLTGVGMTINSLWTLVLSIFSPRYNKGVCHFCS